MTHTYIMHTCLYIYTDRDVYMKTMQTGMCNLLKGVLPAHVLGGGGRGEMGLCEMPVSYMRSPCVWGCT